MQGLLRRLLIVWLLLLGGVLLAQHYGYVRLAYYLLWLVALGSLVVALL